LIANCLLACLTIVLCLNDSHLPELGFKLTPVGGWGYWFRLGLQFLLIIIVLCGICGFTWWLYDWPIPLIPVRPSLSIVCHYCVDAPFYEELVFRSLLFVAVVPTVGGRGAIILSGVLFAVIHILRGNPGPDNQIAGFMLGWALLKSRTILVPIAMHSAGNFIAVSTHIACWYFFEAA
jgi:membrane protease YdiL (CAAX protease family)